MKLKCGTENAYGNIKCKRDQTMIRSVCNKKTGKKVVYQGLGASLSQHEMFVDFWDKLIFYK